MKIKVEDATYIQLNHLVATLEGHKWRCAWMLQKDGYVAWQSYEHGWGNPTPEFIYDWSEMGPIIEREKINCGWDRLWEYDPTDPEDNGERWYAEDVSTNNGMYGASLLIAVARCYVVSKLGEEVEIPEELK